MFSRRLPFKELCKVQLESIFRVHLNPDLKPFPCSSIVTFWHQKANAKGNKREKALCTQTFSSTATGEVDGSKLTTPKKHPQGRSLVDSPVTTSQKPIWLLPHKPLRKNCHQCKYSNWSPTPSVPEHEKFVHHLGHPGSIASHDRRAQLLKKPKKINIDQDHWVGRPSISTGSRDTT